jgi:hypothetical protein
MKIADDSEATPVCVCVKLRAPVPLADQFGTTPDNTLDSGFMTARDLDAIYACLSAIPAATPGSCTNAGQ